MAENLKEEIKIENVDIKEEILISSTVENTCNVYMKDVKNESQGKP